MRQLLHFFTWKITLILSVVILAALIVLNFYGIYTNRFYFLKPDSYVFVMLAVIHFTYLYVVQFKIREEEMTDPKMRNLEYILYAILLVYAYKIFDSIKILSSYEEFKSHDIPTGFLVMGNTIMGLYMALLLLTLMAFAHRKFQVGNYSIKNYGEEVDSWE